MVSNNKTIGIVGVGMVGGALRHYFESEGITPALYDPGKHLGSQDEINRAEVVFLCVPTPFVQGEGFDISFVEESLKWFEGRKVVVLKSTVVPGTTERLQKEYPQHRLLFNPEFLVEEKAVEDMIKPDRQIVGYTNESKDVAHEVLRMLPQAPFEKNIPATEAELVKYFGNTFLAMKVIFANEMYALCETLGTDYTAVRECAAADPRINASHLDVHHGGYRGYGGKCLPKDTRALIEFAEKSGMELRLHKLIEQLNNELMERQQIADPETFSQREQRF